MKIHLLSAFAIILLGLCACSDDATGSDSNNQSGSGRIEAGMVGTWVENPSRFSTPDTMVFSESKIRTRFFSAVGTQFSAKDGLVKGGPSMVTYGEYVRVGDTLYFDALLGEAPDGVDTTTAARYLKVAG
jgi:hypothetical protein